PQAFAAALLVERFHVEQEGALRFGKQASVFVGGDEVLFEVLREFRFALAKYFTVLFAAQFERRFSTGTAMAPQRDGDEGDGDGAQQREEERQRVHRASLSFNR